MQFDTQTNEYLKKFTEVCKNVLGEKLAGLYLQGSASQGDYNVLKSDIDIVGVCTEPLLDSVKDELASLLQYAELPAPSFGMEFVIATLETVKNISQSPAYEFWFGAGKTWPISQPEKAGLLYQGKRLIGFC